MQKSSIEPIRLPFSQKNSMLIKNRCQTRVFDCSRLLHFLSLSMIGGAMCARYAPETEDFEDHWIFFWKTSWDVKRNCTLQSLPVKTTLYIIEVYWSFLFLKLLERNIFWMVLRCEGTRTSLKITGIPVNGYKLWARRRVGRWIITACLWKSVLQTLLNGT